MDGLSTTASVIALIQLTGSIVKVCCGYIQGVKDASEEIKSLQLQVVDLKEALEKLSELCQVSEGKKVPTSQTLVDDASKCLRALERRIDPGNKRKAMSKLGLRALAWPLNRGDVEKYLKELESYKLSFIFSLELYQSDLMTDMAHITRLIDRKTDFSKLRAADGAEFNSYENRNEDECLPGTRAKLLRQITEWPLLSQGKCIFWLCGMAGTGKSTISRTVAKFFEQDKSLGASFFFKRGEADRGNAKRLFPTITKQIIAHVRIPQLELGVQKAISDDPNIAEKSLREQFEKLLLQTLLNLNQSKNQISTLVIVIDALDECEDDNDIRVILQLLPRLRESNAVRLRILLTSRPDLPINRGFSKITIDAYQDLVLHEIPEAVTKRDISLFLNHRFLQIRNERSLPADWPGNEVIHSLVTLSVPLFIFAATVCRIFDDHHWDPMDSLTEILTHRREESKLALTYLPVLRRLLNNQSENLKMQLVRELQEVVGAIVILENPLSISSLARLTGIPEKLINLRLSPLHSVLRVPKDKDVPVRLFHLSFREFLLREKTEFWVEEEDMHQRLTARCLLMCDSLRRNLCGLPSEGISRIEIERQTIDDCLSPELQYSCRYWAHHLAQSKDLSSMLHVAFSFLKKHLLHWMEAMSILGLASEIVGIIDRLLSVIQGDEEFRISEFLYDAKRFILKNRPIINELPLQIYCSGLVFTPTRAIIRTEFERHLPSWICRLPKVEDTWSAELQILEGHSDSVRSVAFSPDGRVLASSSEDETVKLWETATGDLQQTLKGHSDWVGSLAFSPDGRVLASGSWDQTIKLWETATGDLQQTLEGHSDCVRSVAFSPDSRAIASGSWDQTIKLWNTATGDLQQTLKGHSDYVRSVAFSPDGQALASGSLDQTIKLWNTATGDLQQTLEGHLGVVESVVFSPDSRVLASGSEDKTVKLWDTATGNLQQILKGHSSWVRSVAFSPNGRVLASGSWDKAVKLWDTATGALQQTLEGHSNSIRSIAFSPDGRVLASGSDDKMIRFWDIAMGGLQETLKGHSSWVGSVAFSPNGRALASGSVDQTVKIWDTATGALQQTLKGHLGWLFSLQFSPDGRVLASGSEDHTVKLWDTATGDLEQTLQGHSNSVRSIAFSPDGRVLASGSDDKMIRFWDTATGELQQTLEGHSDEVVSLAFSPDGRVLASGSNDRTVKIWDIFTGALRQSLEVNGLVTYLRFSEDGSHLCTNLGSLNDWSENDDHCAHLLRADPEIFVVDHWISLHGTKVLWLPPEYRALCFAIRDRTLALGHASGRISFIEFSAKE